MNGFRRADVNTFAAVDARILIDDREVVLDLDGADRARAHTPAAGDAGDFTGAPRDSRRPMVGACDVCRELMFRNQADQPFRTGFDTFPASRAKIVIDFRDAVFDVDRVEFTDIDAIAETEAPVSAGVRSREQTACRCAVRRSRIFVPHMRMVTRPLTEYVRDQGDDGARFDTERRGDGRCCILTARCAERRIFFRFIGKSGGVGGTAAIAAAAAVRAGENAFKLFLKRIFFYAEETKDDENGDTHQKRDAATDERSIEDGIE